MGDFGWEVVTFQEGRHATCKRPQDDRAIAQHTHTHTSSYVRSFGKCFNNLDKVNTFRLFFPFFCCCPEIVKGSCRKAALCKWA